MAYISITDLPELLSISPDKTEYLLITNTNVESNKLQLSTLASYIEGFVRSDIDGSIDAKLNDAIQASKFEVLDEGISVGTTNKINFIGATVNSFINDDSGVVDVYIPSAALSSNFNTTDGATNCIIPKAITYDRYIADPIIEGSPFKIGTLIAGTLQKCVRNNLSYTVPEKFFMEKNSKIKLTLSQNGYIIDTLEIFSLNGDYSSNFISASISNITKELNHLTGNLDFSFDLKNSLKGIFSIKVEHFCLGNSYIFTEENLFFDNDLISPSITTNTYIGTLNVNYLSGIKYLNSTSTIKSDIVLKNAKNITFPLDICDIDGTGCGLGSYILNFTSLGLTNYFYNSDITFTKEYNILSNKFYNGDMVLKSRVNDWENGNYISTTFRGLVSTYSDNSTRVYEDFVSETNRLKNSDFTIFDKTLSLGGNTELQVYNSKLVYPQLDFSEFYNNYNYSGLTGTRSYIRKFWHTNYSHSNGIFQINGNILESDLLSELIKIEISLDGTTWFNCNTDYLGGVLTNGSGCRINSDTNTLNINNKIEFTLGLNKFTNSSSNWGIYIKITFKDTDKSKYIDILQITNWN